MTNNSKDHPAGNQMGKKMLNDSTRAVTIHQTHDSVRITFFDPRFGSYHDFFVGGGRKKKKDF